jgi:hypothetical protein
MIRVVGPTTHNWDQHQGPPTGDTPPSAVGTTRVPQVVFDAIVGTWNAATNQFEGGLTIASPLTAPMAVGAAAPLSEWFVTSEIVPAPITGANGQAVFTSGAIAGASNLNATDIGHGSWLLWEHSPETVTPANERIPGFMVNLPTYWHEADPEDSDWIYDVHVFPKGSRQADLDKTFEGPPVAGSVPAIPGDPNAIPPTTPVPAEEYTILNWRIQFDYDHSVGTLLPNVPPSSPSFHVPASFIHGDLNDIVATDTFILIQDQLDPRLRLMPNSHPSAATTAAHWDANFQLRVYTDNGTGGFVALPRMDGTDANWIVETRYVAGSPRAQQIFYVAFTAHGVSTLVDRFDDEDVIVRIDFSTIASNLYGYDEHNEIENYFNFNFGTNDQIR